MLKIRLIITTANKKITNITINNTFIITELWIGLVPYWMYTFIAETEHITKISKADRKFYFFSL